MLATLSHRIASRRGGGPGSTLDDIAQLRADLNDGTSTYRFIALDVRENLTVSGTTVTAWSFASQSHVAGAFTISGSPQFNTTEQSVQFDGVDDRIYSALLSELDLAGAWSMVVVGTFPSAANDRFLCTIVNSAGTQYWGASRSSSAHNDAVQVEAQSSAFDFKISNVTCGPITRCAVLTKTAAGAFTLEIPDSGTVSGSVPAFPSASYRLVVGGRSPTANVFDGTIKAVVLVNRQLTSAEIDTCVNWANGIHGAERPGATTQIPATVTVAPTSFTLGVSKTRTLSAQTLDTNGAPYADTHTWASNATGVATVNSSGVVTGVSAGTATITATSVADPTKKGTSVVTVVAVGSVSSVKMYPSRFWMVAGVDTTKQMDPRGYDTNGVEVTGRTWQNWASSDTGVATVDASGVVTLVAAGTPGVPVLITAEDQGSGLTATCKLWVDASLYPNEPSGMTVASASFPRHFDAKASAQGDNVGSEGWDSIEGRYFYISNVSTASAVADPADAPTARGGNLRYQQMHYPVNFAAGTAPGLAQEQFTVTGKKTCYVSMWYRISEDWEGHFSDTNKTFFIDWTNTGTGTYGANFFVSCQGKSLNPLAHFLRFQGGETGQVASLPPNLVTQADSEYWVDRGEWERWEFVLYSGTPGLYDGTAEWWVNGVKIASYTGLNYKKSTHTGWAAQFKWQPIWGGGNQLMPRDGYHWLEEVYCSVK